MKQDKEVVSAIIPFANIHYSCFFIVENTVFRRRSTGILTKFFLTFYI